MHKFGIKHLCGPSISVHVFSDLVSEQTKAFLGKNKAFEASVIWLHCGLGLSTQL